MRRRMPITSKWPTSRRSASELSADIVAATGVMSNFDRVVIDGRERDVKVIGTDQEYQPVRNIVISSGRFLDAGRSRASAPRWRCLPINWRKRMFGSTAAALDQVIRLYGLQFTVIGTFHEKVETFGQSEVERDTMLVPITVLRYFTPVERIDPLYVQVRSPPRWTGWRGGCRRSSARGTVPAPRTAWTRSPPSSTRPRISR